jgi:hypothetical protein
LHFGKSSHKTKRLIPSNVFFFLPFLTWGHLQVSQVRSQS